MVFVGNHAEWGRVDVTLSDLGCGRDRTAIHRPKDGPAPLICRDPECGWALHLVHVTHGGRDLWYLRHADGAPHCPTAGESMAHHLLKLDLALAVRDAGGEAELEALAPDGSWRADVLATMPDGRLMALEAQMSTITVEDIERRTARYSAAGVEVCWFTDRKTVPWLGVVPAVQVARAEDGGPLLVVAGAARFAREWCVQRPLCERARGALPCGGHGRWVDVDDLELERFVAALVANTVRPYRLRVGEPVLRWIARRYFEWEAEQLAASEVHRRAAERAAAVERRREQDQADHLARIRELEARQAGLRRPVRAWVCQETGDPVAAVRTGRDPEPAFAMGLPVTVHGELYGVICPVASRLPALRQELEGLVFFAATEREAARISGQAPRGQQVVVLEVEASEVPEQRAGGGVTVTPVGRGPGRISVRDMARFMTGVDRM
ncbi:competence protein CoiA family protein [Streptomyces sp. Isolate_45]|uniref:competence protein CoiA family protein n=1 Tax=Streptomyces sp. Isolate_45 TaxID=2950111 RepID=UPI002481F93E|nr:competence protein CoiA family protein [Streptomyces sp. Isolate_45]MDA5279934.1 competence protein CoiA family protein [Streptomyces sp. Isolate_45]